MARGDLLIHGVRPQSAKRRVDVLDAFIRQRFSGPRGDAVWGNGPPKIGHELSQVLFVEIGKDRIIREVSEQLPDAGMISVAAGSSMPLYLGGETVPPQTLAFLKNTGMLMQHIQTQSIRTYPTKVESGWVLVAI